MAVVIQIENLVKRYKELVALDHLNLEVEEGEIFGLLGQTVPENRQRLIVFLHCLNTIRER